VPDVAAVLTELRQLVARADNDFGRSWWDGPQDVLVEVDGLTAAYDRSGEIPDGLHTLFLPTSGLHELAISSGWGSEFTALADRFDEATGKTG
jgi:hypothetical protein